MRLYRLLAFCLAVVSVSAASARADDEPSWDCAGGGKTIPWPKFEKAGPSSRPQDGPDPVFPEDGSLPMKAWYTSSIDKHKAHLGLKKILEAEGVQVKDIGFDYEWIQDVALFSTKGTLLLQADMPADPKILTDLTRGVLNDDDGFASLRRLTEENAGKLGLPFRWMGWTFLEGGELITGRFSNGETYAIMDRRIIERTKAFYRYKSGKDPADEAAMKLVAADLGIKPANLFAVKTSGHLDLIMAALPGGKILLSDPSRTQEVLGRLIAKGPPAAQKERLSSILHLYSHGHQRRYSKTAPPDIADKPMGKPQFPYDDRDSSELEAIEAALKGRFKVVRVAGVFNELEPYANSEDLHIGGTINFFNGLVGANARGEVFIATNGTSGLTVLEDYWRDILAPQGVQSERIHFPGRYRSEWYHLGSGLDCAGASSGN